MAFSVSRRSTPRLTAPSPFIPCLIRSPRRKAGVQALLSRVRRNERFVRILLCRRLRADGCCRLRNNIIGAIRPRASGQFWLRLHQQPRVRPGGTAGPGHRALLPRHPGVDLGLTRSPRQSRGARRRGGRLGRLGVGVSRPPLACLLWRTQRRRQRDQKPVSLSRSRAGCRG